MTLSWPASFRGWSGGQNPPVWLRFRSSTWLIGLTVGVGAFTDGFLYGIVVPVLPFSLRDRSGVSEEHVQFWSSVLLMTFGITMTISAPIAGWVGDRTSRRFSFLLGLTSAFLSTLLFIFARAPSALVVARAFQGLSAGVIYTAGLALIADSVSPDKIGSWMGFVLSGMNVGGFVSPLLGGIVYARSGYYAVFSMALAVIAFDLILQISMIEKGTAAKWFKEDTHEPPSLDVNANQREDERTETRGHSSSPDSSPTGVGKQASKQPLMDPHESSPLLHRKTKSSTSWFAKKFPIMAILLGSPRLRAAVYGCFTHTTLVSAFDATLPLFVERTFGWDSAGAGLIFLALSSPSILGTLFGVLSDRYGTRRVSLSGFALTTLCLALSGLVMHDSMGDKVLLCVLLTFIGIGLNLMLAPLAADMFYEVELLAEQNSDRFGKVGAYAQAYSLFDAALGFATVVGPGWTGLIYEQTNWLITAMTLALFCGLGSVQVYRFTGRPKKMKSVASDESRANEA
ncbi:MAG: hypothetical protein M1816_004685 [Peltula sp. TS41687]|nr:MAG: hypothetical protein M1816_004685 [Peltula sp. TS41687]